MNQLFPVTKLLWLKASCCDPNTLRQDLYFSLVLFSLYFSSEYVSYLLHLLHIFKCTSNYFYHDSKQFNTRSDCSLRSSLILGPYCLQLDYQSKSTESIWYLLRVVRKGLKGCKQSKPRNSDFLTNKFLAMREYQPYGAHSVNFSCL